MVQTQADWNETDESAASFIKNKPDLSSTSDYNEACSSTTFCELVNTVNKLLTTVDSLKDVIANLNNNATPTVTTNTTVEFDHGQATVGGNVTNAGFGELTERGICYGTSENPTVEDSKVVATGTTTGAFTCLLSGLETDQKYYARAYATNAAGTTYGDNVEFTIYEDPQLSMVEVTVAATGTITAQANLAQEGINTITELGICWGTTEDIDPDNDGSTKVTAIALGDYTLTLEGEFTEGTYYVRAYAKTAEGVFTSAEYKTFTITAPEVTTGTATVVDGQMQLNGELTKLGTPAATEMGVCWGTTAEPNVEGDHQAASAVAEGEYSVTATNLTAGTYNARAYATYAFGTVYGDAVEFTISAPVVTTGADPVVDNEGQKVTVSGNVTDAGSADITKRGICYGTTAEPDTTNKVAAAAGTGEFSATLTDLTAGVTYYARAYAVNAFGIAYGEDVTFQLEVLTDEPVVTTGTATYNTATGNIDAAGEVVSAGLGGEVTERGICYSTSANPTVDDSKVAAESAGTGEFNVTLTGLTQNTIYHLRAYATNAAGTSYGDEITVGAAYSCGDKIKDIDGNEYRTVKIGTQCWMAEDLRVKHTPSGGEMIDWKPGLQNSTTDLQNKRYCYEITNDNIGTSVFYPWATAVDGTVTTNVDTKVQGICPTGWHIPSYKEFGVMFVYLDNDFNIGSPIHRTSNNNDATAQNSTGKLAVKLSNPNSEWRWYPSPGVSGTPTESSVENTTGYNLVNNINDPDANKSGFNATANGYLGRSRNASNPDDWWCQNGTLNLWCSHGSSVVNQCNTVKIAYNLTGIGHYVYSGAGADGQNIRCINDNTFMDGEGNNLPAEAYAPVVTTNTETALSGTTLTVSGNVTEDYGSTVTARGICWGTSTNPTLANYSQAADAGGTGEFSVSINTLGNNTHYYLRAYATNANGTRYGNEIEYTTNFPVPTVTTGEVTYSDGDAIVAGTITDNGGSEIQERGICYSTSENPTIDDNKVPYESADDEFSVVISGLEHDVTYYARAYATNESGTGYGEDVEVKVIIPFACGTDKLVDIDGNEYNTVLIGEQCWMAENLRVKHYDDGSDKEILPWTQALRKTITNRVYAEIEDATIYDGKNNTQVFYTWSTATNNDSGNKDQTAKIQGICPKGWHIPSYREYVNIFKIYDTDWYTGNEGWTCGSWSPYQGVDGPDASAPCTGASAATCGKRSTGNSANQLGIKFCSKDGIWEAYGGPGIGAVNANSAITPGSPGYANKNDPDDEQWKWNESGFNAYPAGYISKDDQSGQTTAKGHWFNNGTLNVWTSIALANSTTAGTTYCHYVKISCYNTGIPHYTYTNEWKTCNSVRCVKD